MRLLTFSLGVLFGSCCPLWGQSCCAIPDLETTQAIVPGNLGTPNETTEYFQQTLSDAAGDSFLGQIVYEEDGQMGSDGCWNNDPKLGFFASEGRDRN